MFVGIEKISDLKYHTIVGYFEQIKCVFFAKNVVWGSMSLKLEFGTIEQVSKHASALALQYDDPAISKLLATNPPELFNYLIEDDLMTAIISANSVFERILSLLPMKEIPGPNPKGNYEVALDLTDDQLLKMKFFSWLYAALLKGSGRYAAHSPIKYTYQGEEFVSEGQEGEKIFVSPKTAHKIVCDLESLSLKVWADATRPKSFLDGLPTPSQGA